jgi:hypothetical protein
MAIKQISKSNTREETTSKIFEVGGFTQSVNPDLISNIIRGVGVDSSNNQVHKIIMNNNYVLYVNDSGLTQATT